ncbi:DUF1566 domain-containing protein [Desulfopila sp. IMCC35008]|uniref:DUF1566 domain-containing protein n=1 Tax=Desulfopila sp. IMCC35008 TaxID=2653858 RepID=UPI0013D43093|nr:DUF1566 domain-containing protein [Desulfopila sp. IMCC35008]
MFPLLVYRHPVLLLLVLLILTPYQALAGDKLELTGSAFFKDTYSQHMWQLDRSKRIRNIRDINNYLVTLNQGQYSDWRLPSKQELYNLFAIFDHKQNGEVKARMEGYYWLTDDKGNPIAGSWEIGDQCGPSRTYYQGKSGYIRAIRP